jgi:transposase
LAWRDAQADHFRLDYLPPYSPDLNPIERVWKLTRKLCIHDQYFPTLASLIGAVEQQFTAWAEPNDDLRRLCSIAN